jgi:hypothetical protein
MTPQPQLSFSANELPASSSLGITRGAGTDDDSSTKVWCTHSWRLADLDFGDYTIYQYVQSYVCPFADLFPACALVVMAKAG